MTGLNPPRAPASTPGDGVLDHGRARGRAVQAAGRLQEQIGRRLAGQPRRAASPPSTSSSNSSSTPARISSSRACRDADAAASLDVVVAQGVQQPYRPGVGHDTALAQPGGEDLVLVRGDLPHVAGENRSPREARNASAPSSRDLPST